MNREIKFKGQNQLSQWVYGYILQWKDGTTYILHEDTNESFIKEQVVPDSVCQYTGLKDKDGVEIYEGDLLQFPYDDESFILQVTYNSKALTFGTIDPNSTLKDKDFESFFDNIIELNEADIIGNIHDTIKLLSK